MQSIRFISCGSGTADTSHRSRHSGRKTGCRTCTRQVEAEAVDDNLLEGEEGEVDEEGRKQ